MLVSVEIQDRMDYDQTTYLQGQLGVKTKPSSILGLEKMI
jgi:hypothetical protein